MLLLLLLIAAIGVIPSSIADFIVVDPGQSPGVKEARCTPWSARAVAAAVTRSPLLRPRRWYSMQPGRWDGFSDVGFQLNCKL